MGAARTGVGALLVIVVGADVWKRGWVAVTLDDGRLAAVAAHPTMTGVIAATPDADVFGVDIPIGLPAQPPRESDGAARKLLGPRASSVFPAPPRDVLEAPGYADARALSVRRYGSSISAQAYALRHRILEVAPIATTDPRLYEVHPEVSFLAMAGAPLAHAKRTWNGQTERRRLLGGHGIVLPKVLDGDAGLVPPDDVLDAAAAAWSALRIATGGADHLPPDDPGPHGVIWF